jgi:anaerobic selenocysteine-containing dehydrogenase
VAVHPDADAWLLLSLLHVLFEEGLADARAIGALTAGAADLRGAWLAWASRSRRPGSPRCCCAPARPAIASGCGANVNVLASGEPEDLEPLAGMAFLNGIPVRVRPADRPAAGGPVPSPP